MKIACVLKSGGIYTQDHVMLLKNQIEKYCSVPISFVCFSDKPLTNGINWVPLRHNLPTWWSKLELFDNTGPMGQEDLLYFDLDVAIYGDIAPILKSNSPMILDDWYFPNRERNSTVMRIPARSKAQVWKEWVKNPRGWQRRYSRKGDQAFIGDNFRAGIFQRVYPRFFCSYKKNVAVKGQLGYHRKQSRGNGKLPKGTVVLCFHGQPKPWDLNLDELVG